MVIVVDLRKHEIITRSIFSKTQKPAPPWNIIFSLIRSENLKLRRRAAPYGTASGDAWRRTVPCRAGSGVKEPLFAVA